jgi:hypothetical protein
MNISYSLPSQIDSNWSYLVSAYANPNICNSNYKIEGMTNYSHNDSYFQATSTSTSNKMSLFIGGYRGSLALGHP